MKLKYYKWMIISFCIMALSVLGEMADHGMGWLFKI